jgi:hypothetical protein
MALYLNRGMNNPLLIESVNDTTATRNTQGVIPPARGNANAPPQVSLPPAPAALPAVPPTLQLHENAFMHIIPTAV